MEETGYRDAEEKEYQVGDIVVNPFFGDYWIVGKYADDENMKQYEDECPYYLCQYGDPDLYFMDLDEPAGFKIVERKGTAQYNIILKELNEIAQALQKEYGDEKDEKLDSTSEV